MAKTKTSNAPIRTEEQSGTRECPMNTYPKFSRVREYRVLLTSREVYEIWIVADNGDVACDKAERLWTEAGTDTFRYRDGALDDVMVIEERESGA